MAENGFDTSVDLLEWLINGNTAYHIQERKMLSHGPDGNLVGPEGEICRVDLNPTNWLREGPYLERHPTCRSTEVTTVPSPQTRDIQATSAGGPLPPGGLSSRSPFDGRDRP